MVLAVAKGLSGRGDIGFHNTFMIDAATLEHGEISRHDLVMVGLGDTGTAGKLLDLYRTAGQSMFTHADGLAGKFIGDAVVLRKEDFVVGQGQQGIDLLLGNFAIAADLGEEITDILR